MSLRANPGIHPESHTQMDLRWSAYQLHNLKVISAYRLHNLKVISAYRLHPKVTDLNLNAFPQCRDRP